MRRVPTDEDLTSDAERAWLLADAGDMPRSQEKDR